MDRPLISFFSGALKNYYFTLKLAKATTPKRGIFAVLALSVSRFGSYEFFGSLVTNFRVLSTKDWHFIHKFAKT